MGIHRIKEKYFFYERKASLFFQKHSISFLRMAMGVIYFWYGLLKVLDISPVEELVSQATQWIRVRNFVLFLGVWEILIGICLFTRKWNRLGLWLLFLQFPGAFLPLFLNPEDCFTIFPYGLTLKGQYIFKNLILIAAGFVLIGSLYRKENHLQKS